jgi:hypothetical protein
MRGKECLGVSLAFPKFLTAQPVDATGKHEAARFEVLR